MLTDHSAGIVIFRNTSHGRVYLLLQHPDEKKRGKNVSGHWDFPKGHLERDEDAEAAAKRELEEEAGISRITMTPQFQKTIRYFFVVKNQKRLKFVIFFLAETSQKKVAISHEHQNFAWMSYRDARKRLTYANARRVLQQAELFLRRKEKTKTAH